MLLRCDACKEFVHVQSSSTRSFIRQSESGRDRYDVFGIEGNDYHLGAAVITTEVRTRDLGGTAYSRSGISDDLGESLSRERMGSPYNQ